MKSLLLIPVLLLSVACGNKSSSKGDKVKQIFVKGNPLTMVSGTEKNTTSFITPSNIHEFRDYALSGLYIFAEKELLTEAEEGDIEAGQEAEESDRTENPVTVFNMGMQGGTYTFTDRNNQIGLDFVYSNGRYEIDSFSLGSTSYAAEIQHYSLSADKSKMSFLLKLRTKEDGNVLISIAFHKNSTKKSVPKVSSAYHYVYGKGVVVPWKLDATRKVYVDLCPSVAKHMDSSAMKEAVEMWEAPFRYSTQKLDIEVRYKSACKPFSDVEEHSVHYVEKYLTIDSDHAANYAFTVLFSDLNQGNIYDSDIILLGSEIKKNPYYDDMDKLRTMAHEFGHFLGLDHQFDGPASIMSYEDVYSLRTYDNEAIRNLYQ